jgi:general stress protein 26
MFASPTTSDLETIQKLIAAIKFAMLTTELTDHTLHARPMAVANASEKTFDSELWFFSRRNSGKIAEIQSHQQVNLSFADSDHNRWLSLAGSAEQVDDHAKVKELWNPALKAWFPGGVDDPEITLIRVTAESAQFWEGPPSSIVKMLGFAKAALTGKPYQPGESHKVELTSKT